MFLIHRQFIVIIFQEPLRSKILFLLKAHSLGKLFNPKLIWKAPRFKSAHVSKPPIFQVSSILGKWQPPSLSSMRVQCSHEIRECSLRDSRKECHALFLAWAHYPWTLSFPHYYVLMFSKAIFTFHITSHRLESGGSNPTTSDSYGDRASARARREAREARLASLTSRVEEDSNRDYKKVRSFFNFPVLGLVTTYKQPFPQDRKRSPVLSKQGKGH